MNKRYIFVLLLLSLLINTAYAGDYVRNSSGKIYKNSFGECWRGDFWTKDKAIKECECLTEQDQASKEICKTDTDGDGVYDDKDKCPDTPKGVQVDAQGCELDSDGDGVKDSKDQCPDTPKGVMVNEHGCTIENDQDQDGVLDAQDQCPDTLKGQIVNAQGCSRCQLVDSSFTWDKECKNVLHLNIDNAFFDFNKATLKSDFSAKVDSIIPYIKENTAIKRIRLVGHTDNVGSAKYNNKLSLQRAKAVKRYLVNKGLNPQIITVEGKGFSEPLASNRTETGRAKNRRVEVNFLY